MTELTSSGLAPAPSDESPLPDWVLQYVEGATLDEIAFQTGVTKPQVVNRLKKLGIHVRSVPETNALRRQKEFALHGETIRDQFLHTRDIERVAVEVGMPVPSVKNYLEDSVPDYQILARAPRNPGKRYTKEDLVASLREASQAGEGVVLTNAAYQKFVESRPVLDDGRQRPGKQVMGLRFGSWTGALHAAGLPANPPSGPPKQFDDESAAICSIVACWQDLKCPPSVATYDRWQRGREEHPSSATARKLLGSWNLGLVRAWQIVHSIVLDQDDADVAVPPSLAKPPSEGPGADADHAAYRPANEDASLQSSIELSLPNYLELERALSSHARIQNALASELSASGATPWSPTAVGPQFDLAFAGLDNSFVVVEVKSCTVANLEMQLRLGLGQVLRYSHELRSRHGQVRAVLATELDPPTEWLDLLDELAVEIIREATLKEDLERVLGLS